MLCLFGIRFTWYPITKKRSTWNFMWKWMTLTTYAPSNTMRSFSCRQEGLVIRACPEKAAQSKPDPGEGVSWQDITSAENTKDQYGEPKWFPKVPKRNRNKIMHKILPLKKQSPRIRKYLIQDNADSVGDPSDNDCSDGAVTVHPNFFFIMGCCV